MALILLPLLIAFGSVVSITNAGPAEVITALSVLALGGGAFYGLMHFVHSLEGTGHGKRA
jgi:hypothetical protein